MKKILTLVLIAFFSLNFFATNNSSEDAKLVEDVFYPKVHVYCDGEYAGYFYNINYTASEVVEMADSMCDGPQQ